MRAWFHAVACVLLLICTAVGQQQQAKKPGLLDPATLKEAVPSNYFFDGLVATVQVRNTSGIRFDGNKLLLAAFVDNSGYSSDVQEKYQGLLITEANVTIGNAELGPGQYGFGFTKEGNFVVLNVAADQIFSVAFQVDDSLKRPVPLKIVTDGDSYRLYAGKKYVVITAK
jgi:hypothetical protein